MEVDELHEYSEYTALLSKSEDTCVLCDLKQEKITIQNFKNFVWIYSAFPYRKFHTLLIPRRHIIRFSDLNKEELEELSKATLCIEERYKERGVVSRDSIFGDQLLTSYRFRSSLENSDKQKVLHLHIHFYPKHHNDPDLLSLDKEAHMINLDVLK